MPRDGLRVELILALRTRSGFRLVFRFVAETAAMAAATMHVTGDDARSRPTQNAVERHVPPHHLAFPAREDKLSGRAERSLEVRPQCGHNGEQARFTVLRPGRVPRAPDADFAGAQVNVGFPKPAQLSFAHASVEGGRVERPEPHGNLGQHARHFLEAEDVVRPPNNLAPGHRGNGIRPSLPRPALVRPR